MYSRYSSTCHAGVWLVFTKTYQARPCSDNIANQKHKGSHDFIHLTYDMFEGVKIVIISEYFPIIFLH